MKCMMKMCFIEALAKTQTSVQIGPGKAPWNLQEILHEIMKLRFLNTGTQGFVNDEVSVCGQNCHVQFCR